MRRSLPDRRETGGDQRFLIFLLLSMSILLFSNSFFAPPVEQPKPGDPAALAENDQQASGEPADADSDTASPSDEANDDEPNDNKPDGEPNESPEQPLEDEQPAELQLVSIGATTPDGPYRMLLTLTNEGAAIQRAELSSEEFRDLDDASGYLGELAVTDSDSGGVVVSAVGAGTPAAEAGIEVGHRITKASDVEIENVESFRDWLYETPAGSEVQLTITRPEQSRERTVTATLARRPLAVIRPESENIALHSKALPADFKQVPSFLVRLDRVGTAERDSSEIKAANERLTSEAWQIEEQSSRSVTFRKRLVDLGIELVKRFELVEVPEEERESAGFRGYHFDFDIEVRNLLNKPQRVVYQIEGPNGLPIEGFWYAYKTGRGWGAYGLRDVVARYQGYKVDQYSCAEIAEGEVPPLGQGSSMAYIGVDAQYFSVMMIPEKKALGDTWFDVANTKLATAKVTDPDVPQTCDNPTFTATRKLIELAPAGTEAGMLKDSFTVFAGPKRPELLQNYMPAGDTNYSLRNLLYYGWFGPVARVMLSVLHTFYAVVGNYGIAIVLLTVLVRGMMFPLSRKQAMNMAKMQELKPEMDRIADKYKDDMQKRSEAQRELFQKHNYNPMGGCVLMFFQLPIFIGLYRALSVDIELRQAPLIAESVRFCGNLAAPDRLLDWSAYVPQWFANGNGIFALGPYLNILPIVTVVLFLLQQKLFMPEPTNEQAVLQQKMMKYMMAFFGLMFFKVPSGLCIYFIASSLWGIAERKLLPKPPEPPASSSDGFSKPKPKPTPSKANANRSGSTKQSGGGKKGKKKRR